MAKLDLGLINMRGEGRPVPSKMDLHIIKYVIGNRKRKTEEDESLLETERWDHSDAFYAGRTHLNKLGWDTSVYNDNIAGGADRRKAFYGKIKPVCEDHFGVKRHQIGIYPEDRAVMAFNGRAYSVGFDELRTLMGYGTDVLVVEKQGTIIKMVPFTRNIGIAFIQSQGFVSEYGTALASLCNGGHGTLSFDYTKGYTPKYTGHLGVITDCDSSGVMIGLGIKNATRIGIDLDTITEMNKVNSDLGIELNLKLEDLQESTRINTHWISLDGILHRRGKVYEGLSYEEKKFYGRYLSKQHEDANGDTVRFIDYLEENRIELNTILAAAKPEPFWNWLRWKLLQLWPSRNYRRALFINDSMRTPTYKRFEKWYDKQTEPVIKDRVVEAKNDLLKVEGFYEDVDGFEDNVNTRKNQIETDIVDHVLTEDEKIQKIDLGLESIMQQFLNKNTGVEEDDGEDV